MQPRIKQVTILVSISLLVGGCASTKEAVLPQDGPSMQAIYEAHLEEMAARDPQALRAEIETRPLKSGDASLEGYTRDAHNEIETIFPRLPNPTLVMYVFPHLATEERVPVPGYATTFPMYKRVEYALPGEVSSGYSGDTSAHINESITDQSK
ncbi:MAG: TIGR03751 family conjugal transfer lipoprotein [Gammaproteobacteria bacterium]|nr:TIGR03751 family conjugal transfer lipoprotein [Gammaproteobacteria bacterium]